MKKHRILFPLLVSAWFVLAFAAEPSRMHLSWLDYSFESVVPGSIAASGVRTGWEVQRTGREVIQERLQVRCVKDADRAHFGEHYLSLAIPAETVGFEFVTVGQRVKLDATQDYEASVWVRWPAGPDAAPADASATSGRPSAIVSFWARHRDGLGAFAGRDEWLFDNQWHRLTFRFRATNPEHATFIYVSLLPNQKPTETLVLVDDFELQATPAKAFTDERGERVKDPSFAAQKSGAIAPPWFFANIGGKGIRGDMVAEGDARFFRLGMDKATSNYESAQLWQHLDLSPGAHYEITCRMRWENFTADAPAPIVNFGIYHEPTRTWYGPVDQVLEKTGDWRTYRFTHIPPQPGPWKLYVQLNGWGNFGHAVTVSFDDLHCTPTTQKP